MFQETFSNGLALVPETFYPAVFNAIWHMTAGQRMSTKEYGKVRQFAQEALRLQRSIDVTGGALAQTPWIRYFAPKLSGFTELMQSSWNTLKYMEVIPCVLLLSRSDHLLISVCSFQHKEMC
jgi:hypothetical protein